MRLIAVVRAMLVRLTWERNRAWARLPPPFKSLNACFSFRYSTMAGILMRLEVFFEIIPMRAESFRIMRNFHNYSKG